MAGLDDPLGSEYRAAEAVPDALDIVFCDQITPDRSNLFTDPSAALRDLDVASFKCDKVRSVALADPQPPVNHPMQVHLTVPGGAPTVAQVLVGWGDGLLETKNASDSLARQYTRKGDYDVRATLVYADGRTATATTTAHVGEPKAAALGIVGILFSPEYQNYTFFAIGLLVTATTSAVAAASVTKGRKRIDRRLRELDRVQEQGRRDAFAAVRSLHEYRLARRRDLSQGHLGDTQYTVLEAHADKVLQVLRGRILGSFVGRVSDGFSHALDTALADGAFDVAEAQQLLARVDDEGQLDRREKDLLRTLIGTWKDGDQSGAIFVLPRARKDA